MNNRRESRLIFGAAVFLFLYSLILTLSPAVREQSWNVAYRLSHWLGFFAWLLLAFFAYRVTSRLLPDRDPYFLPMALLLSGWGLLTIWRLDSSLGLRQMIWLGISVVGFSVFIYFAKDLNFLRRYKYLLLSAGIALTALTLFLGTNPTGAGPRLWLGCCGVYLQPSEPLKLLLVVYLAAYLADRLPASLNFFPLLWPTIFAAGIGIALLAVQQDLGTASIFIMLYTVILYLATGRRRVLIVATVVLILAGLIGFLFINVVRTRLDVWLDPWSDPTGRAYQIVQSLLAIANGGTIGRGPGLGSPSLVPVAQSDFIFSAIAEETGLVGTFGLFAVFGLIFARGIIASLRAQDRFRRLLASGLTAYLGIQALLIVGGNLRIFPLTGETLPFVAYGGSSLVTAFIAVALLLIISNQPEVEPASLPSPQPYFFLAAALGLGLIAAALTNTWWSVIRSSTLLARTDNPRRSIADRYVKRGSLLDRNNQPIDQTDGTSGSFRRVYLYPELAPVTGYTHSVFGQAGLESTLDDYLRGLQGNPSGIIWWDHFLYGMPPPGLDVRLSLDLELQKRTDHLLGNFKGAVILLNAQTGEILVMASHPGYDPNELDVSGPSLAKDPNAPLINRAAQGMYPAGTVTLPFYDMLGETGQPSSVQLQTLYKKLGFYTTPQLNLPVANAESENQTSNLKISPLQMALAAATLSNAGVRPAPRIALAVNTPQQGWVVLPAQTQPVPVFSANVVSHAALQRAIQGKAYWEWSGSARSPQTPITWYVTGTLPNWQGTPLTAVVLIEGNYPFTAQYIGQQLMQAATKP
jgi:cell division protein FtsW (lipid II flippase)